MTLLISSLTHGSTRRYRNLESARPDGTGKSHLLTWSIKVCLVTDATKDDPKSNVCRPVCTCVPLELVGVGVLSTSEVPVFPAYVVRQPALDLESRLVRFEVIPLRTAL